MPLLVAAHIDHRALLKILLLLLQCRGLVWNFTAFNHALSCGPRSIRSHDFRIRSRLRVVILKVPIRRYHCLPNTIQVRMAVSHPRRAICRRRRWCGSPLLSGNECRKGDGSCDKSNRDSRFAHSSHRAITRFGRGQEILKGNSKGNRHKKAQEAQTHFLFLCFLCLLVAVPLLQPFRCLCLGGLRLLCYLGLDSPSSRFGHVYRAHDERSRSKGVLAQLDCVLVCISHFRSAVEGVSSPQSASP